MKWVSLEAPPELEIIDLLLEQSTDLGKLFFQIEISLTRNWVREKKSNSLRRIC
jgi:hypothetical protein